MTALRLTGGKMKIGVDAGCLAVKDERLKMGVFQVTFNLLEQLGKIDKKNSYYLYSFFPIKKEILARFGPKMRNVVVRPSFGWRHIWLPLRLFIQRNDVFLGPSQALPTHTFCPSVVIIHDLAFEYYSDFYSDFYRLRKISRQAAYKANKVIAVSNFTKSDLIEIYKVPKEKVSVSYEGCNSIFKKQTGEKNKKIKEKYKIEKEYFLFVGALKKSKNLPRILKAFSSFGKTSKKDFLLILVGSDCWLDKDIQKIIEEYSLKDKVKILGFVPQDDLPKLYSGALAFISPSLYEGFGITFLEAFACGCPVIAGAAGAMEEVIGKAGILVNPGDEKEIEKSLFKIADNEIFRKHLIEEGYKRLKYFSWKKFALDTLKVIESL